VTFIPDPALDLTTVMRRAIALALKAQYQTDPNPMVGAVLISAGGRVLAEGFHRAAGAPHAEVMALQPFTVVPPDAILVVTLEPCNHSGRTPPCTDLIIRKQVRHVVIGCLDPNPRVSGAGIERLRRHGIRVETGVCEEDCRAINPVFNKHIVTHLPYVTVKAAMSLDGRIALPSGESRWITGEAARRRGHQLRSQHQAIAVGSGTLRYDNPRLTDRVSALPRQPMRIVFAGKTAPAMDSDFVSNTDTSRFVLTGQQLSLEAEDRLRAAGVVVYRDDHPQPRIRWGLETLYDAGICSLLVEGGGMLTGAFLRDRLVDRLCLFIAGKVIGAQSAPGWSGELGLKTLAEAPVFRFDTIERLGDDLLITGLI
jgi:diaminohydroxyphosphoribosylaminopyrimidine deaminase / 5-amino-6-(5-phosphoribosylamino)uracil reductase